MAQTIRTAQLAKHLGISSRDLREKILQKVNFPGVKPTDKEMSMAIASGIVRVASRMLKISCPPLNKNQEEGEENITPNKEEITIKENTDIPEKKIIKAIPIAQPLKRKKLSALERLRGIGNQSQGDKRRLEKEKEDAIAKRKSAVQKRIEDEKKKELERSKKQVESRNARNNKPTKYENRGARNSKPGDKKQENKTDNKKPGEKKMNPARKVMRKIEITKEEAEAAKKRKEARELARKKKKEEEEQAILERKLVRKKRQEQIFTKKSGIVELPAELTVKEFAEKIGVPTSIVITELIKNGIIANITQKIDYDTAEIVAEELEVTVKQEEESMSSEDLLRGDLSALLAEDPSKLKERAPIVAIVGHVDHGKTSILDAIRNTKVIEGESGGITQHIGAYSIIKNKKQITFLDTPGHAAFTAMRSRGAKTADIVVLVVAADDGVKPQTIEAISHAKEAGATIIVAANKIDKDSANLEKLKGELSENHIQVESWGGTIPMVEVSALKNIGIDDLIDMILLQAEMLELTANPKRLAVGTVVEAHLDPGMGPVATVLVNTGTMKLRDRFILGSTWGKVKVMIDENGKRLKEVPPSGAVQIAGMADLPVPGDIFQVVGTEKELKKKKIELEELKHAEKKTNTGISDILSKIGETSKKYLNIVIKADTIGSIEAIEQSLNSIGNSEVDVKIVSSSAGAISESDIMTASAAKGILVAFHSSVSNSAKQLAEKEHVEILSYKIIYNILEDIESRLELMLVPDIVEKITGTLDVKGVFYTKGKRKIIGGKVSKGYFEHPCELRFTRRVEGKIITQGEGKLTGIQHFEEKVKRIESPQECGLNIEGFMDEVLEGDFIEGVIQETIPKTMQSVQIADAKKAAEKKSAAKKAKAEKEATKESKEMAELERAETLK
ncbi:TPA: translation initiation factor IF-2 [Candidatus Gracilibacteria bacterium]|nr:translation initiation factor IF-2 [Candidatus Gracilibacteria bacterium]